jgi:hypothetical protein
MPDGLLERIVRESGVPDLVEVLAERLAPTDLHSLGTAASLKRAGLTDIEDRQAIDLLFVPENVLKKLLSTTDEETSEEGAEEDAAT